MDSTLVLLYDTMFGDPLRFDPASVPPGFKVTADRALFDHADMVVFHGPEFDMQLDGPKNGQVWLLWTMECEEQFAHMKEKRFLDMFRLSMTYKRKSDVWVPYLWNFTTELTRPPETKFPGHFINMFVSGDFDQSGRIEYAKELMKYVDIHSYGRKLRNRTLPHDEGILTKLNVLSSYKFSLAMENAFAEDYVTEKFYDPLRAGSVPVYLGAPNVEDFAPGAKCYIDTRDFSDPRELALYLEFLNASDHDYAEYLAWRGRPLKSTLLDLLRIASEDPMLRLCSVYKATIGRQRNPISI